MAHIDILVSLFSFSNIIQNSKNNGGVSEIQQNIYLRLTEEERVYYGITGL